jgi:hypothetical protein
VGKRWISRDKFYPGADVYLFRGLMRGWMAAAVEIRDVHTVDKLVHKRAERLG